MSIGVIPRDYLTNYGMCKIIECIIHSINISLQESYLSQAATPAVSWTEVTMRGFRSGSRGFLLFDIDSSFH